MDFPGDFAEHSRITEKPHAMQKTFDELLELAQLADNDGRPATVVELLTRASKYAPGLSARYELTLADNLRVIGRTAEARQLLQKIGDAPNDKAWLINVQRGQLEQDSGNFQAAAYCLETAVEQNPESTIPYIYLASAYSAMEQHDKAIDTLKAALRAEGDRDEVYLNLGYRLRAVRRYEEAREAFQQALNITPNYADAEEALRDVDSALEIFNEQHARDD